MLIKHKDYERIYKVINSIIKNEGADPSTSCIFFGTFGSYLLSKKFKLDAKPRAGLAAYHTGIDDKVILFGEEENGLLTGAKQSFHCWVESNGWVIDFMAPAFPQLNTIQVPLPSKMFQRPLKDMAKSLDDLKKQGDFFLHSTAETTAKHLHTLTKYPLYGDLAEICSMWFEKYPKKIHKSIKVGDAKGNFNSVQLTGNSVTGAW